MSSEKREGVRLQKILSTAGVASRRASEQLILEGRVSVNGAVVRELGSRADPARDDIRVDGRRVRTQIRHRYIALYKPRGYVTTRKDPEGRPTVLDLLGKVGTPPQGFLRNPTSCGTNTFSVDVTPYTGAPGTASDSFDTVNCEALPFSPEFSANVTQAAGPLPGES